MTRPTLSLAMIAKNEEAWIREALDSVRGLCDELIVVDTGSTDATAAIAGECGATVVPHPWRDDFSEARNAALQLVKTDWVLMLDADERLVSEDHDKVRSAITDTPMAAYNLRVISVGERGDDLSEAMVTRLFRSDPRIRWRNRVHEQIVPSILEAGMGLDRLDVRLIHYGYLPDVVRNRGKVDRNRDLIDMMIRDVPRDPYWPWQKAQTEIQAQNGAEAIRWAKRAWKLADPRAELAPLILVTLGKSYWIAGELQKAHQVFDQGTRQYPRYTDVFFLKGKVAFDGQRYADAEAAFIRALELGDPPGFLQTETGVGSFKSWWMLFHIAMAQGDFSKAHAYLILLLKGQPYYRKAWTALGHLTVRFDPVDVMKTLAQHVPLSTVISVLSQWPDLAPVEQTLLEAARKVGESCDGSGSYAHEVSS